MARLLLPLVIEPAELEKNLGAESLLIVDLCRPETCTQAHVPGAVHLDYAQIVAARRSIAAKPGARSVPATSPEQSTLTG